MEDMRAEIGKGIIKLQGRDTNAVAGVLKYFFRELPELIPAEINNGAKVVLNFAIEPQDLIDEMKNIIAGLPKYNYETFKLLIRFMNKIKENQSVNKMTMDNILRVMIPTLNCLPSIVSVAMDNYDFIFEGPANHSPEQNTASLPPKHHPRNRKISPAPTQIHPNPNSTKSGSYSGTPKTKSPPSAKPAHSTSDLHNDKLPASKTSTLSKETILSESKEENDSLDNHSE